MGTIMLIISILTVWGIGMFLEYQDKNNGGKSPFL